MMSKADASKKKLTKFEYPKDIDKELIPLLDTIGSVPGLRPLFSCCGHRYKEFYLVLGCSSEELVDEVLNIFTIPSRTKCRMPPGSGEDASRVNQFKIFSGPKYKVILDFPSLHPNFALMSYEYGIRIYSSKVGHLKAKERREVFKSLRNKFLALVPEKWWQAYQNQVKNVISSKFLPCRSRLKESLVILDPNLAKM